MLRLRECQRVESARRRPATVSAISRTSLIYRSALGYELVMRVLYGRHYTARMAAVGAQVPSGSSVLELCCGPGTLHDRHLRGRARSYVGLDVNDGFVQRLRRRGIDARQFDLASNSEPLPGAEIAIIQASLYHFLPDAHAVVDRMIDAASDRVIVSEPIRNLASSDLPLIGRLTRGAADPGVGGHAQRFTEESLDGLMERYRPCVLETFLVPGGREKVFVLDARPRRQSGTGAGP